MTPALCTNQAPVPPPSYHRTVATALHLDALTLVIRLQLLEMCRVAVQLAQQQCPLPLPAGPGGARRLYTEESLLLRALLRAGLPDMRFHDLRHTAVTLLLSRGVHPKVVSEMLGHADIAITLRVYAHVLPNMQLAAVTLMDTLFGGEIGSQATEEGPCERPAEQAHQTQTVVKTVVNAEKDEAQAATGLGSGGGDGGESNSVHSVCRRPPSCARVGTRWPRDVERSTPVHGGLSVLVSGLVSSLRP